VGGKVHWPRRFQFCAFAAEGRRTVGEGIAINRQTGQPAMAMFDIMLAGSYPTSGEMMISSNQGCVVGIVPYMKMTNHELGHFHGMAHANAPSQATVMRYPHGDQGRYLPSEITLCDENTAFSNGQ
jgi:hypothetical protein